MTNSDDLKPPRVAAGDRMLDSAAAAEFLGVTTTTMHNWRRQGTGPAHVRHGTYIRYYMSDLVQFVTPNHGGQTNG
ncbi:helix-turn-helix domain-containing protein [Shimia sp. MIT1388]|uniref:helix-turn-helix domain-containing protein n=1 Tax=Shimia sp. MIT1388 TaxID=3096992 RepID=UPI00399AEFE9